MSRFDPDPDKPYGICSDCAAVLPTREDVDTHLKETMVSRGKGSSHSVRITNRSRVERIKSELQDFADEALRDFADKAWDLTSEGVTEEEINQAMRFVMGDFEDAWKRSA